MLLNLHIENIAVIEKSDVEFFDGFNVLTGETGAGKSIIIDSINLLLGNKCTRDIIRTGADHALVSAVFCKFNRPQTEFLAQNDVIPDEDGNVVISRKISLDGRSFAKINGEAVTVSVLKKISGVLVNIHGQHDGSKILDPSSHIEYLDEYCNISDLISDYEQKYKRARELRKNVEELTKIKDEKDRLEDSFKYKIEELEQAEIKIGERDTLKRVQSTAQNSAAITMALLKSENILSGEDGGVLELMHALINEISTIEKLVDGMPDILSDAERIKAEIENISASISGILSDYEEFEYSPEYIEQRLYTIEKILSKYSTEENALESLEKFKAELLRLEDNDSELAVAAQKYTLAMSELEKSAKQLSEARKTGAKRLSCEICNELKELDMPNVKFDTRIMRNINSRGGNKYSATGFDCVEFMISPNAGQDLKPISKIASGGELSRIMLCLKTILNAKDADCSTIIYDEIDTGVSGSTAEKIGYKLKKSAKEKQVFSITHLAQIAALADHHYKVEKESDALFTRSNIRKLGENARRNEIARIMGGINITDQILKSADELINNSKKY